MGLQIPALIPPNKKNNISYANHYSFSVGIKYASKNQKFAHPKRIQLFGEYIYLDTSIQTILLCLLILFTNTSFLMFLYTYVYKGYIAFIYSKKEIYHVSMQIEYAIQFASYFVFLKLGNFHGIKFIAHIFQYCQKTNFYYL